MNGDDPSSSSRDSLQDQRDLSSHGPLIPEVCLRLQRPLASTTMPQTPFTQPETSRFHPQKPNYIAPTQYSTQIPLMVQISPGIWSDGNRKVMSANHPDVKAFIADARRNLKLPVPPSEIVFVLAALEVFYKPGDPIHWLFWSDDKKYVTAEVVTRISRMYSPGFDVFRLFDSSSSSTRSHPIERGMEWNTRIPFHSRQPPRFHLATIL